MERIRPEFDVEIGTVKERADGISDSKMRAFNRAVLIGGVGTCGAHFVFEALEETADFRVMVEFSALVQVDVLTRRTGRMVLEKVLKP